MSIVTIQTCKHGYVATINGKTDVMDEQRLSKLLQDSFSSAVDLILKRETPFSGLNFALTKVVQSIVPSGVADKDAGEKIARVAAMLMGEGTTCEIMLDGKLIYIKAPTSGENAMSHYWITLNEARGGSDASLC